MASIFRQAGSPYWYASFFDGSGRRRHRSTKTRKKNEARLRAAEFERLARQATATREDEKSAAIFRVLEEAGAHAVRGTLTEAAGREFLNRIHQVSSGEPIDSPSVQAWLRDWVAEKKQSRSENTHIRYEGIVRSFLAFLPAAKRKGPLAALTIADFRRYRDSLKAGGRSPRTVNNTIKILRGPITLARKHGYITHNPAEAVEAISGEAPERQGFTPEQVGQLVAAADGEWKGMVLAGYYTGARLGDLARMPWSSVDLDDGVIRFTQGKTKRKLAIPVHPELRRWLEARPRADSSTWVFPSLAAVTASGRSGLSRQFRAVMDAAGIEAEMVEREGTKGRRRSTLSFHSLRHTFNSEMANAGVPQEVRQRLTGHASKAVNDAYTHTQLDTLRDAVAKVPGLPTAS